MYILTLNLYMYVDLFVGNKHVLNSIVIYKQSVDIPRTRPLVITTSILIDVSVKWCHLTIALTTHSNRVLRLDIAGFTDTFCVNSVLPSISNAYSIRTFIRFKCFTFTEVHELRSRLRHAKAMTDAALSFSC